jgi:flagellar basal-body rod protein FlgG
MIRSLWIAKTGMEAQQTQLDTISNNLANVATNGYKKSHAIFEDLIYQNVRQAGANTTENTILPTGLQVGLGVRTVATARMYTQGALQQTSNNLDMSISGTGFFQIQMPDGSTGYTRDGSFQTDANGQVVTNAGYTVLPGITLPPGTRNVTVGGDGTITITTATSSTPQTIGQIQLASFTNPAGLDPRGQNIFMETASSGAPNTGPPNANGMGMLYQGFVEQSNVNVVEELVQMIQTQRAYELNSKAVQTSDQMLQKLAQL